MLSIKKCCQVLHKSIYQPCSIRLHIFSIVYSYILHLQHVDGNHDNTKADSLGTSCRPRDSDGNSSWNTLSFLLQPLRMKCTLICMQPLYFLLRRKHNSCLAIAWFWACGCFAVRYKHGSPFFEGITWMMGSLRKCIGQLSHSVHHPCNRWKHPFVLANEFFYVYWKGQNPLNPGGRNAPWKWPTWDS